MDGLDRAASRNATVLLCSGAVVDASHILTLRIARTNQNGVPAAASSLSTKGLSNYTTRLPSDAEQIAQ